MLYFGKRSFMAVCGLIMLGGLGLGSFKALCAEDRELTDAELGMIFGKQPVPNPNPLCTGCIWDGYILTPDCVADDLCANCRISEPCPTWSYEAVGTLHADKVRTPLPPEETNDDIKVRKKIDCRIVYTCERITVQLSHCPAEGSQCQSAQSGICDKCQRGRLLGPDPTDTEFCKPCN